MKIAQIHPLPNPLLPSQPSFRAPARGEVALIDLHGGGFLSLHDTLTGYGRATGYDSLANARRAAYMLSVGAESPAAGIFRQGDRYYVRAIGGMTASSPHAIAEHGAMQLLHFEGNAGAHFAWVRDTRLVMLVDGATKVWAKDAHHRPPAS
jgi:hypothetical protein